MEYIVTRLQTLWGPHQDEFERMLIDSHALMWSLVLIYALDVTADGRIAISAEESGVVVATDTETGAMKWTTKMDAMVLTLRIVEDRVIVAVVDREARVLHVNTGEPMYNYVPLGNLNVVGLHIIPSLCSLR